MSWKKEKDAALQAAKEAGEVLQNFSRSAVRETTGRDLKHEADIVSEKIILRILKDCSPKYPILTEESGEHGKIKEDRPVWIVDPLDGTLNYSLGIDFSCVSIALWKKKPVLGVIYDFNRDELFSGIIGQGAWCNEIPIKSSKVDMPKKSVLATGFPVNRDFSSDSLQTFLKHVQRFKKIRLFGSAALSLAYVACGRVDAYFEENIMLWDVAAGIALVEAVNTFVKLETLTSHPWARDVKAGGAFMK